MSGIRRVLSWISFVCLFYIITILFILIISKIEILSQFFYYGSAANFIPSAASAYISMLVSEAIFPSNNGRRYLLFGILYIVIQLTGIAYSVLAGDSFSMIQTIVFVAVGGFICSMHDYFLR